MKQLLKVYKFIVEQCISDVYIINIIYLDNNVNA